nr:MAG TPA: protein of unknown function (DUF3556) [Caudoviricetes sp.]
MSTAFQFLNSLQKRCNWIPGQFTVSHIHKLQTAVTTG